MVKPCFLMCCSMVLAASAVAQNRTNVWELGYSTVTYVPNTELRYLSDEMDTNSIIRTIPVFDTDAGICDTNGILLFYTNGLTIGNRLHDTLQNAIDFNPGYYSDWSEPEGLLSCQAALIVPFPGFDNKYILFHESGELFQNQVQPLRLSYSVIDMNLDNGFGGIVDTLKNKVAIDDTLTLGGINAVKHANGRDWWIIVHDYSEGKYYEILVTPDGIGQISEQHIGTVIENDVLVQSAFSPDGTKYCLTTWGGIFEYMSFNRCTGELNNLITSNVPDSLALTGCSISPNNRFLYISTFYDVYQYDTWDSNMVDDVIHIAAWDSFKSVYNIPVLFFLHQLAPDGKIYMAPWNSSKYLNVISSPDSLGLACNFEPHSYVLPQEYNVSIPSFPNYDLGPLSGSPCDTLNIPTNISNKPNSTFTLSPNPTHNYINIVYSVKETSMMSITDAYGRQVKQLTLYSYFKNRIVYVDDLAAGMYFVQLKTGNKVWVEKMVKE